MLFLRSRSLPFLCLLMLAASGCDQVQQARPGGGLLQWVEGERAQPLTGERKPPAPVHGGAARPG